jgi:argininosuccinate lyase
LELAYAGLAIDRARMRAAAADGTTVATDVAEGLVRGGTPFRDAHAEVARRIAAGERFDAPTPEEAIAARTGPGMPGAVDDQLARLRELVVESRSLPEPVP